MSNQPSVAVNNQTEFDVNTDALVSLVEWFDRQESFPLDELSVGILDDDEMARLNEQYHDESGPTDVLSFDYGDGTGEILLNPYQHRRQSDEFDNDTNEEFTENVIHALLHLSGYDHTRDDGEHLERQADLIGQWATEDETKQLLKDSV